MTTPQNSRRLAIKEAGTPAGRTCLAAVCLALLAGAGCDGNLDAGHNTPNEHLPLDPHCPVILDNDSWSDNWAGEEAFLLANSNSITLAGVIVNASKYWPKLGPNLAGWESLVDAARQSGLRNIPDVTVGASATLKVPADRKIDSTTPLHTPGAELIVDLSRRLYLPKQPLLVITGSQLTNIADAYLIDKSVAERVIVVASLGFHLDPDSKTVMTGPNGDLDPWADWIVAQRFTYVQIAVRYDQTAEVTAADVGRLPSNAFGDWMKKKQPNLSANDVAADQLAILAAALPKFVLEVTRSAPDTSAGFNSPPGQGPPLLPDSTGDAWVVTQVEASMARKHLWEMLQTSFKE
jgi:hypothetical protein